MRKKVFVVNNGGHDFTKAEAFGDIVFCTEGSMNRYDTAQMYRELSGVLEDAHADDYLLLTSLTTLCSIATAIMANQFGCVNLLLFKDGEYVERNIILEEL